MSASSTQALEFLERQPGVKRERLYHQPSTALAVFRRMLPHLAKSIVMAMLYMTSPFPVADLDVWIRPDAKAEREQAISILTSLNIISTVQDNPKSQAYSLAPTFANSLRLALTGGGNHRSFGVPSPPSTDEDHVDIPFLDNFAKKQWEAILYYMVGPTTGLHLDGISVARSIKELLSFGNFVEVKGSRAQITQAGFNFILQDVNAQVWSFLIVYLENAPNLKMDQVDVLSFLFMLGSLELGQAYSTANLTATQRTMLVDLKDFGLVYRRDAESPRFYPTRLATTLTSDASALQSGSSDFNSGLSGPAASSQRSYIIIETNYRLYAYTNSLLQIAVLSLFSRLTTRFPNLVSGKLTKESIQRAIGLGITSDQIVSYLTVHAHPQMLKNTPVLPPTVVDQIRLWQIEGDRMKATPGYLFKEFSKMQEYEEFRDYAESLGVLVWKNDASRCFFVNKIEQIQQFVRNRRAAAE